MKTFAAKVAGALSFAHLAGLGGARSAKAEEDDDKKKEQDREDGNAKKGKKAESDNDDDKKDDEYAEGEDDDTEMAADDDTDTEDDDKDDKKGKKAKAADDDDDKDEEMHGKSAVASARLRERARCAAIFASPAAAKNPVLAANLAFKTKMSRGEAVALLEGTPAPALNDRNARAARNPRIGNGDPGAAQNSPQAIQGSWDRAFNKVNGRK